MKHRWATLSIVRLTVDNTYVALSLVTYNDGLNYGRFDAPGLEIHSYAAFFPRTDFIRLLSADYAKCMAELKRDDERTGEVSDLAAAGWPPLSQLLTNADLAAETIECFLCRDTFNAFGLLHTDADFVINSTDVVRVDTENVIIMGRCFRRVT